jgi:uncharacterized protein
VDDLNDYDSLIFQGHLEEIECSRLLELVEKTPVSVDYEFTLKSESRKVMIKGKLKSELNFTCDRCLVDFAFKLDESLNIQLQPLQGNTSVEEEILLTLDELEWDVYDQPIIDLAELLEEQVLIFVPAKKLCDGECLGLCPSCGVNLNQQKCLCNKDSGDHPFAVLKGKGDHIENLQN